MDEDRPEDLPEGVARIFAEASRKWVVDVSSITKQLNSVINTQATLARSISKSLQPFNDAIRLHSAIKAQATIAQGVAESMRPFYDAIQRTLSTIDLSWVREATRQAMPPNWRELDWSDVDRVLAVMGETGWCLVWCPRGDIVRALMDEVDGDARQQLLLGSKAAVVQDMTECLSGMNHTDSAEYRNAVMLAIRAFDAGHVEAAQALAASVISAIINGGFRLPSFAKAKARFEGDPKEASIRAFREQAVFNMVARGLQEYFAHRGDPVPPSFSRHATAHSVADEQYNEVNSLASLLLAVAFAKEADVLMEWSDQQEPDVGSEGR